MQCAYGAHEVIQGTLHEILRSTREIPAPQSCTARLQHMCHQHDLSSAREIIFACRAKALPSPVRFLESVRICLAEALKVRSMLNVLLV